MAARGLLHDRPELLLPAGTLVLGALLLIPWLSEDKAVAKFPLVGKEVGSFYKRQMHFLTHAWEVHHEGYTKVRQTDR